MSTGISMKRPGARGFSIVEVMIIVVIIGVLSLAGAPMYRQYVIKSAALEAEVLLRSLAQAERQYYAEQRQYYAPAGTAVNFGTISGHDPVLDVRAVQNKVFNTYKISGIGGAPFTAWRAETTGEANGQTLCFGIEQHGTADPKIEPFKPKL